MTPYPFGYHGTSVDLETPACEETGDPCALLVSSLAFRSWNRGLAAVYPDPEGDGGGGTTPFGVWIYNGVRWYPNPTFPGGSVCKGDKILWAGKLDYWLVGEDDYSPSLSTENWPALCRFDGANYEWEAVPVPAATLADVPQESINGNLQPEPGGINAGACLAWNDCWFFGTYGVVVHWDGQTLSNVSVGLGPSPWLDADYTAAIARTDLAGNPFAVAVTAATSGAFTLNGHIPSGGTTVAAQPDGSAAPQLFASSSGGLSPTVFSPPTAPGTGTDLVAVDFNSAGQGWVAGDPSRSRATGTALYSATPGEVAPLVRVSTGGATLACQDAPPTQFVASTYLWSSIGVFPDGDALAGGESPVQGSSGITEPVLVQASCDNPPIVTRFRIPDATATNPASAPLVPANQSGTISSVAVNAINDAWAASIGSSFNTTSNQFVPQVPHLYHLTDTQPPLAPAGNDDEPRPLVTEGSEPVQYVVSPPVLRPAPPPPTKETKAGKTRYRKVRLPAPIYAISSHLERASDGTLTIAITFKVRSRNVIGGNDFTIGAKAYDGNRLVYSTGLRRFEANTNGQLDLVANPTAWPTRITFVLPKTKQRVG